MAEKVNACDQYTPAIGAFFAGLLGMSLDFASVVVAGGSPITPEVYGPMVYAIPALAWVSLQAGASLIGLSGVLLKGRLRAAAYLLGAIILLTLFSAFAIMAQSAPQGSVLAAGARAFVCPLLGLIVLVSGARIYER